MNENTNQDFRTENTEIVYQIFPDRFRNGDPNLTPKPGAWDWHDKPIEISQDIKKLTTRPNDQYTFFGGDFAGIRQSIPHLVSLGITTVYLNPIFAARSVHRYDTIDYLQPDSALGSRADFDTLVNELHKNKIKIFLDGVFNHTSRDHPWHIDENTRSSKYIMQTKSQSMTWMNHGSLPKLDTQNEKIQKYILEVLNHWSIVDGWRLDAAHLLPQNFLKQIRDHISPKPIIVEDWNLSPHYFDKQLADGITNFPFRNAMKQFFTEDCSPETLLERLQLWINAYPAENHQYCWNYLDNHDLPRFISEVGSRERLMRALVLQFTLPGTPQLFQGTEFGMEGHNPTEARTPLTWQTTRTNNENTILNLIRTLSRMRHQHQVLTTGNFQPLYADNRSRTLAFLRENKDQSQQAIITLNDGYQPCKIKTNQTTTNLNPGHWRIIIQDNNNEHTLDSREFHDK